MLTVKYYKTIKKCIAFTIALNNKRPKTCHLKAREVTVNKICSRAAMMARIETYLSLATSL